MNRNFSETQVKKNTRLLGIEGEFSNQIKLLLGFYLYLLLYKRQFSNNLKFFISTLEAILLFIIIFLMKTPLKYTLLLIVVYIYKIQFSFLLLMLSSKENVNRNILSFFQTNFKLSLKGKIPQTPTIFVCNYCSDRLENIACMLIPNISVVMNRNIGFLSKYVDTIQLKDGTDRYNHLLTEIDRKIKSNSIFVYVSIESHYGIGKVRSGVFRIANRLNIKVTPVYISKIELNYFGHVTSSNFKVVIGNSFPVSDISKAVRDTRRFFIDSDR